MNPETILAGTANLFLALGDKTRLRLLNLLRDREVCVSSFIDTLGYSQPLISRHLAYLRNSGIVEARRDGKWIHYSISSQLDENTSRLLFELFKWMEQQEGLRHDREGYQEKHPAQRPDRNSTKSTALTAPSPRLTDPAPAPLALRIEREEKLDVESRHKSEPSIELESVTSDSPYHNELEDFLL